MRTSVFVIAALMPLAGCLDLDILKRASTNELAAAVASMDLVPAAARTVFGVAHNHTYFYDLQVVEGRISLALLCAGDTGASHDNVTEATGTVELRNTRQYPSCVLRLDCWPFSTCWYALTTKATPLDSLDQRSDEGAGE